MPPNKFDIEDMLLQLKRIADSLDVLAKKAECDHLEATGKSIIATWRGEGLGPP